MFYWIPAIIWMAFIYYLSSRTGQELGSIFPFIENFNPGHIMAFFILALLLIWPLRLNNYSRPYLKAFIFSLLYGVTDEIHQYFVPTRTPDGYDLLRDAAGTLLALVIYYLLTIRMNRKNDIE